MSKNLNLTKEQAEVLEAKGSDILVAASAGSGKTFVVVERILNRIVNDYIDIDKILVVTFTNAAASELKERILNKFYDFLKDKDVEEEKKRHIEKQIKLINRAQISTIHSFCLNIIKSNFYALEIDPNVRTLDENKAKLMLIESIDEVVEKEYEEKSEEFIKALEIFKTEEKFIEYIEKIYNFSQSLPNPQEWLKNAVAKYSIIENVNDLTETEFGSKIVYTIKEKLELLYNQLEIVCNKISFDKEFESRLVILENMMEKIDTLRKMNKFDDIYYFLKEKMSFPKLPNSRCVNEQLKKEVADMKKKATLEIANISKTIYLDTKGMLNELNSMYNIIEFLASCVEKVSNIYSAKKLKSAYIDFSDYEHLAYKILQNEELAKQYSDKFEDIYIDEYQDTSYLQELLISTISKNNRIMVGDVKQSIYSFRNAEPKLFNEKYNNYKNYEDSDNEASKILLSQNFRSRKAILNSINEIFEKIMSEDVGECDYTQKEYLSYGASYDEKTEHDNITELHVIETEEIENMGDLQEEIESITNTEKEAYMIADKIKEIIKKKKEVYDLKRKEYRRTEYRDIVILLRSVSQKAAIYEEVLKANGIPAFSDASDSFYNGQEVGIILSFLKVIDNIYDDISLASCLYSIIGKFTLDDLVYIRSYNKNDNLYNNLLEAYSDDTNKDKEIYIKIQKFMELLEQTRMLLNTCTLAELLLKVYDRTGIYYSFYLEELGKQKCANLDSLVEMARNFEREEKSSIYEFIKYIENIKEKKTKGGDSPKLIGEGENVVRILTIHKSKGLEYPIVFLADASKKYNIRDMSEEIVLDKELGIGTDIYKSELGISYPSVIKQAIKEKIKNKTISEEERLLYVAMTRAKEKLYIYGTVKNYEKMKEKALILSSNEKISPVIVKEMNSYLKLILLVLNFESSDNIKLVLDKPVSSEKELNNIVKNDMVSRDLSTREKFLKICQENKIEPSTVNETFNQKYKYEYATELKKKYSATELKQEYKGDDERIDNGLLENLKPQILDNSINNMHYGTIIHKILENINYKNTDLQNLDEIIKMCFEGNNINLNVVREKICKYLNSDIKKYIIGAKEIRKEQPFVIYDNLDNIENLHLNDKTYIQGVIDLFIVTKENKRVIIDFKTDSVDDEKVLIDRYKIQLEIYKKGIELSLNKSVDEIFIYSFHLNKLIKYI